MNYQRGISADMNPPAVLRSPQVNLDGTKSSRTASCSGTRRRTDKKEKPKPMRRGTREGTTLEPVVVPKRLNIVLSEKARKDLQEIADDTSRSMTEVVRIALALVKVAFDETAKNNKLAVIDKDGKPLRELVLPS